MNIFIEDTWYNKILNKIADISIVFLFNIFESFIALYKIWFDKRDWEGI